MNALIRYGSYVYGTMDELSDEDFYHISDKECDPDLPQTFNQTECHSISFSEYLEALQRHEVWAIEMHYSSADNVIRALPNYEFELDTTKVRSSFSAVASNSWVKAKKKLQYGDSANLRLAQKSLFHSFRILDFAVQLGTHGSIVNFMAQSDILMEVKNLEADWVVWDSTFRLRHKELASRMRLLCKKSDARVHLL